jgi:hypothetical protein
MKRLQVGDECYVRWNGTIHRFLWDSTLARVINKRRSTMRIVYPYPIIKQLAK